MLTQTPKRTDGTLDSLSGVVYFDTEGMFNAGRVRGIARARFGRAMMGGTVPVCAVFLGTLHTMRMCSRMLECSLFALIFFHQTTFALFSVVFGTADFCRHG